MKATFVPIDLSTIAEIAAEYAFEFARFSNDKLILFHAYSVPVTMFATSIKIVECPTFLKINQGYNTL